MKLFKECLTENANMYCIYPFSVVCFTNKQINHCLDVERKLNKNKEHIILIYGAKEFQFVYTVELLQQQELYKRIHRILMKMG